MSKKIETQSEQDTPFDFSNFQGFVNPTTTPTPDLLFDKIMQDLNKSELKVLLYIIRRTYGFKKKSDNISLSQLVDGIQTKRGKVLDRGTGLSISAVKRALRSLKDKNLIDAVRNTDPKKGNLPTTYSLKMNDTPRPANGPRVGSLTDQGLAHQGATQQTVKQQTDSVVRRLMNLKISKDKANELAQRFSDEYITNKFELLDWKQTGGSVGRPIKDPAGWLIRAIENDYKPPKGSKSTAEGKVEKKEAERRKVGSLELNDAARESERNLRSRLAEDYRSVDEDLSVWEIALRRLQLKFSRQFYDTWLKDTSLVNVEEGVANIGAGNDLAREQLIKSANDEVEAVLSNLFDEKIEVRFEVL